MHKYYWCHLMITISLVIREKHNTQGSSNSSFDSFPFLQKLVPFWFLKAWFLPVLLGKISLFPHLMTSLILELPVNSQNSSSLSTVLAPEREPTAGLAFSHTGCLFSCIAKRMALQAQSQGLSQTLVKFQFGLRNLSTVAPCSAHTLFVQYLHEKARAQLGW